MVRTLCFQLGWGGEGDGVDSIPGQGAKIPYATYMAEK